MLISDFSEGGLRIQGCFGIVSGDTVALELLTAHRITAVVVWSIFGRAGVRFSQPLAPENPVLSALQQMVQRVYSSVADDVEPEQEMAAQIKRALERDELLLHYQPQMCIAERRIKGAEALVRWLRPNNDLMPFDPYFPIAEKSGLIEPLADWALRSACAQMQFWLRSGVDLRTVTVKLAPCQFRSPNLTNRIRKILNATGLRPERLELEVSETALTEDDGPTPANLAALKSLGLKLVIGDFGTGYSALAYLKHFPVDKLKLDRRFLRDVRADGTRMEIAKAIIELAKSLKIEVVAEGVETEFQLEFLRRQSCDGAQGSLFGCPLPANTLYALMHQEGMTGTRFSSPMPMEARGDSRARYPLRTG